jgi:MoaA/NifB/PqqE/SkfB family radical SAM enzyme
MKILVIEPHNRCNCRCVMCDIWKRTDAREISSAELARHIDDIVSLGVEHVVFTGGEPLMHSDLFRLAAPLRARGIRITLLSTGLLLAHYAARIVDSIDEVIVSLDGPRDVHDAIRRVPGAFDRLVEGVRAIRQASARCTVQARNAAHLRATVAAARAMGLRSISFLAADLDSTAFDRPVAWPESRKAAVAPDLTALEQEMECLIAEYPGDGFILEPPWKLRRIVAHFRACCRLEQHSAPRCNAPWVSAVWEANGDVRPCFFHAPIGNTANGTLAQIVNGPAAVQFRETLNMAENPVCRRCVCSLFLGEKETEVRRELKDDEGY